jgi:hypothetical protein
MEEHYGYRIKTHPQGNENKTGTIKGVSLTWLPRKKD